MADRQRVPENGPAAKCGAETPPSRRRWRTLIVLRRDLDEVWAEVPGWDPNIQVLVWADHSNRRVIPESLASVVPDGDFMWVHASINIGAEGPYDLDFEGVDDWEIDDAETFSLRL